MDDDMLSAVRGMRKLRDFQQEVSLPADVFEILQRLTYNRAILLTEIPDSVFTAHFNLDAFLEPIHKLQRVVTNKCGSESSV